MYKHRTTEYDDVTKEALSCLLPGLDEITGRICEVFRAYKYSISAGRPGVTENNIPRWVAMYLRRDIGGHKISWVADYFTVDRGGFFYGFSETQNKLDLKSIVYVNIFWNVEGDCP